MQYTRRMYQYQVLTDISGRNLNSGERQDAASFVSIFEHGPNKIKEQQMSLSFGMNLFNLHAFSTLQVSFVIFLHTAVQALHTPFTAECES